MDGDFIARLETCFTQVEVVELIYTVMWFAGVHRVNAIFDVEPPVAEGGIWVYSAAAHA